MRREVRATANRLANFDDANLRRSARAAVAAAATGRAGAGDPRRHGARPPGRRGQAARRAPSGVAGGAGPACRPADDERCCGGPDSAAAVDGRPQGQARRHPRHRVGGHPGSTRGRLISAQSRRKGRDLWDSACVSAPSGVVTFLFTDIEGSTRRWESDADSMRGALAAHDEVMRTAIEAHGGFLFKHTGDGVCAAFASPRSAVDAAIAAQRELELPVRMGIATGEAAARDGDYFGAVLNRAARVMAAGHGGQILLAESTASLLTGAGPPRSRAAAAARCAETGRVFQVRARAACATEFPPLRALDTSPGNLRPPTTSLIGRDSETRRRESGATAHRLVTLTGVGGVGKTRLALEDRGTGRLTNSPTEFGFSSSPRSPIPLRFPTRSPRCSVSPNSRGRAISGVGGRGAGRQSPACWCSTTASTSWMPRPIWSK